MKHILTILSLLITSIAFSQQKFTVKVQGNGSVFDSSQINEKLAEKLNVSDTTTTVATNYRLDTVKANIQEALDLKLDAADTLNQIRTPFWKRWVLFGDSFSATRSHYSGRVDSILNLKNTVTQAVSGAMISDQSAKLDSILASTPDYFKSFNIASLLIGVNDWTGATYPLGNRSDTAGQVTFAGYLKHMIQAILTSNPKINLFVITPTETIISYGFHGNNAHGWNLDDLAALESEICSYYGIQCIDLHSMANFNIQTISTLTDDGIHPNYEGSKILADIIANAFVTRGNKGNKSPFSYKNGNYGLEVVLPQATLDIPGSIVTSSTSMNHYRSVATYYSATASTGTMKITLPKGWSDNLINVEIRGLNYSSSVNWKVTVSGKNNYSTGSWVYPAVKIEGKAPFSKVRVSYDSVLSKCVILLGDTTTSWNLPAVEVTDAIINEGILTGWGSGWDISIISSETNIKKTSTVTPTLSMYETTNGNTLFGSTNDDGKGNVQINGRATYQTVLVLDGSDSLVLVPKRYVDAQVAVKNSGIGNINYIPYWSANYSLSPTSFYWSGGNLFNTSGFSVQGNAVRADGSFRANSTFTGMYFDDSQQTIRWYANGGNALKLYPDNTLRYYTHPSIGGLPQAIPDKQYIDSIATTKRDTSYRDSIAIKYPIQYDSLNNKLIIAQSFLDSVAANANPVFTGTTLLGDNISSANIVDPNIAAALPTQVVVKGNSTQFAYQSNKNSFAVIDSLNRQNFKVDGGGQVDVSAYVKGAGAIMTLGNYPVGGVAPNDFNHYASIFQNANYRFTGGSIINRIYDTTTTSLKTTWEINLMDGVDATGNSHANTNLTYQFLPSGFYMPSTKKLFFNNDVSIGWSATHMVDLDGSINAYNNMYAKSFVNTNGGTSAKFLKGDGSMDSNSYPPISSGTAAPTSTPAKVGAIYVDITNKKIYFAVGTSSSADWEITN